MFCFIKDKLLKKVTLIHIEVNNNNIKVLQPYVSYGYDKISTSDFNKSEWKHPIIKKARKEFDVNSIRGTNNIKSLVFRVNGVACKYMFYQQKVTFLHITPLLRG